MPIEAGALTEARMDLDAAMRDDPEFVEKRFLSILRTDRDLAMSLLQSARDISESGQPADRVLVEVVVMLFDAFDKTRFAREFEAEFESPAAA